MSCSAFLFTGLSTWVDIKYRWDIGWRQWIVTFQATYKWVLHIQVPVAYVHLVASFYESWQQVIHWALLVGSSEKWLKLSPQPLL